jgi:hypothetical protein
MTRRRLDPCTLAVGGLCIGLSTAVFLLRSFDRTPPFFDPVEHFLDGIFLLHDPSRSYLLEWRASYPFLDSVIAIPFNVIGSYNYAFTTACLGALFLCGTVITTFLLGRDLFGRQAGLLAAAFVGLYPAIFGLTLTYMLDLSMTFMIALAMLFLFRSQGFTDRRNSLLLGAAIGIGTFTRYAFTLWVAMPVAAVLAASLWRETAAARRSGGLAALWRARRMRNMLDAILVSTAIAIPWYLPRLNFLLGDYATIQRRNNAGYGTDSALLSLKSLLYYPRSLWHIASLPLALAFVVFGCVYLLRRGSPKLVLLSWIVGGYIAATVPARSDTRFFVAILPAIALVTAGGMAQVARGGALRQFGVRLVAGLLVTYSAVQIYGCTVGISWLPRGKLVTDIVYPNDRPTWFSQNQTMLPRLHRRAWDPGSVVTQMKRHVGGDAASVKIIGDTIVTSALKLPIVRATLLDKSPKFVLLESGDPLGFPADFVVVEAPVSGQAEKVARARLAHSFDVPEVAYRLIHRETPAQPLAGQVLFLYERIK